MRSGGLPSLNGLEMIAVSVQETTAADVAEYAETYSLPYTIGFDASGAVFETYRGFGLPTHVFIDAEGRIAHLRYGPVTRELAAEITNLEKQAHEAAGQPFNLGSPKQLQEILFEKLELPVIRKTPSMCPAATSSSPCWRPICWLSTSSGRARRPSGSWICCTTW